MQTDSLLERLRLPLIAAPMTGVSGPALVTEACRAGVIGAFPTHNARSVEELDQWLSGVEAAVPPGSAPVAPNLVVHRSNARLRDDVACLAEHRVELVITSVGSPAPVIEPLHDVGCRVISDVATMRHAERALDAGVDGLVLLTAGAGGQTGWNNPFAFVRAVREKFDGLVVLAGGVGDGEALFGAMALGADLAYMGTRFIATTESLADADYRGALVRSSIDDVTASVAPSGLPANVVAGSPEAGGHEAGDFDLTRLTDLGGVWSAGHSVHGVRRVLDVADLVAETHEEFDAAGRRVRERLERTSEAGVPGLH